MFASLILSILSAAWPVLAIGRGAVELPLPRQEYFTRDEWARLSWARENQRLAALYLVATEDSIRKAHGESSCSRTVTILADRMKVEGVSCNHDEVSVSQ